MINKEAVSQLPIAVLSLPYKRTELEKEFEVYEPHKVQVVKPEDQAIANPVTMSGLEATASVEDL